VTSLSRNHLARERREVVDRLTGERIVITRTAEETGGAAVVFDFYLQPSGGVAFEHAHGEQDEIFRMRKGELTLTVAGEPRVLREGEELTIPAGVNHTLRNATDAEIAMEVEYRPGRRSDWWLVHAHAAQDHLGRELTLLEMAPYLADVGIYPASPPRPVVRLVYALLAPIARLLGKHRVLLDASEAYFAARAQRAPAGAPAVDAATAS
jgi:quercetin dioxygenase-like cupin family protein